MMHRSSSRGFAAPVTHTRSRARARARTVSIGAVAFAIAAGLVAGLCVVYVWQGTRIHELTARRTAAAARLVEVEERNRELRFQIEQAFSLERISRIARQQLGMVEPDIVRYVRTANGEDG